MLVVSAQVKGRAVAHIRVLGRPRTEHRTFSAGRARLVKARRSIRGRRTHVCCISVLHPPPPCAPCVPVISVSPE